MGAPTFNLLASKLKTDSRVRAAARHNLREIAHEIGAGGHIDVGRMHLNRILRGPNTSHGVMDMMRQILAEGRIVRLKKDGTPIKERHEGVRCIELLLTIPAGVVADEDLFFEQAATWIEQQYRVPLLSFVIHRDEGAPHAHALLLPLRDGGMVGGKMLGRYSDMLTAFHRAVAKQHGLSRHAALRPATRRGAAAAVVDVLAQNPALMADQNVRALLATAIERNPTPLMELLGVPMSPAEQPREKEWVKKMITPVKPMPKARNSIEFVPDELREDQQQDERSLSCVRHRSSAPLSDTDPAAPGHHAGAGFLEGDPLSMILPAFALSGICESGPAPLAADPPIRITLAAVVDCQPDDDGRFSREREDQLPASAWSTELGEHIRPTPQMPSRRAQATAAVADAMARMQARIRATC